MVTHWLHNWPFWPINFNLRNNTPICQFMWISFIIFEHHYSPLHPIFNNFISLRPTATRNLRSFFNYILQILNLFFWWIWQLIHRRHRLFQQFGIIFLPHIWWVLCLIYLYYLRPFFWIFAAETYIVHIFQRFNNSFFIFFS